MKWSRPTALLMFAMLAFQAAAALEVSRCSVCFLLAWILWNMQYCMKVFILCFQRSRTSLEFLKRVWTLAAFLLRFKGTFFLCMSAHNRHLTILNCCLSQEHISLVEHEKCESLGIKLYIFVISKELLLENLVYVSMVRSGGQKRSRKPKKLSRAYEQYLKVTSLKKTLKDLTGGMNQCCVYT